MALIEIDHFSLSLKHYSSSSLSLSASSLLSRFKYCSPSSSSSFFLSLPLSSYTPKRVNDCLPVLLLADFIELVLPLSSTDVSDLQSVIYSCLWSLLLSLVVTGGQCGETVIDGRWKQKRRESQANQEKRVQLTFPNKRNWLHSFFHVKYLYCIAND